MNDWIKGKDYPEWMEEEGLKTLHRQHLITGETPYDMYRRIAITLEKKLPLSYQTGYHADRWFDLMWRNWLCPSTPIMANCGTNRGLTISCFIQRVDDSLSSIYENVHQMAMLTKMGGGCGITFDKLRGRGEVISTGGFTEGVIPFAKVYDSAIVAASQGNTRRGSASINLPIRHKDISDFLKIRKPKGDSNRQCLNINHCVTIDDYFMRSVMDGDTDARDLWADVLTTRMQTGQPYIMYYHNVHNRRPTDMVKRNQKIDGTNICSEILLPHDKDHTVVCCLASVNAAKYDEWKTDPQFLEDCYLFLDCNLQEFIDNAKSKPGLEKAIRFAESGRAIGLGILGWSAFLQEKFLPFNSLPARGYINQIGRKLKDEGEAYNKKWGAILGNPIWCDFNRNMTLNAFAPTTSNALVCATSQSIEPIVANVYVQKSAKGTFIRINKQFKNYLEANHPERISESLWLDIGIEHKGSVQHLNWLSDDAKEVFLTAYEINQLELIKNAAIWQKYVDQGISLNLFFPQDVDPKWFNKCHITAWEAGIKTLYYVRTESILSKSMSGSTFSDCIYCEG
jgi:ribonucleoside-diphosphate reductase alpha chain